MHRRITAASVSLQKGASAMILRPGPGINILWGRYAPAVLWALAGIWNIAPEAADIKPADLVKAWICWTDNVSFQIRCERNRAGVEAVQAPCGFPVSCAALVKAFHKSRFLTFQNPACVFGGAKSGQDEALGEGKRLLKDFHTFCQATAAGDDHPLFLYDFLERLDEAAHLQPIFEALLATGRQVFIAVPHYYEIKTLEEMSYDTAIHAL